MLTGPSHLHLLCCALCHYLLLLLLLKIVAVIIVIVIIPPSLFILHVLLLIVIAIVCFRSALFRLEPPSILNVFLRFCGHVRRPENQWPHWVICADCTDAFLNLAHSDGIVFWSSSLQTGLSKFPSES